MVWACVHSSTLRVRSRATAPDDSSDGNVMFSMRKTHFRDSKNHIKSGIPFRENLYRIFLVALLENYKFASEVNLISPIGSEKQPFENLTRHDPTFFCDFGSCRVKSGHRPELTRHDPTWPEMGQISSGSFDFWSWPDLTRLRSGRVMLKAWPDVELITASCPIFTSDAIELEHLRWWRLIST
jgi:hypothetical protein